MHKRLYRSVEDVLDRIDHSAGDERMLRDILRELVENPATRDLGVVSGRLYRQEKDAYRLFESLGGKGEAIAGKTVGRDYQVVRDLEARRLLVISPESPGFDPELEADLAGVDSAAILVGSGPAYILSLGIQHHGSEEDLLVLLETIRAAVGLKLRAQALADQVRQASTIQQSLIPPTLPRFAGFDIAAVTVPADDVGGDVYDVQEVEAGALGVLIADASGHGLPAALQARDVVIGMRMGQSKGEKITGMVSRLNRVIHDSGLASRFISLFYGELEPSGNLVYVNGGHCPPLLLANDDEVFELMTCGPVLGPLPDAVYRRGYVALRPGEILILFTDGVTERGQSDDDDEPDEFGRDRLVEAVKELRHEPAAAIVEEILARVRAYGRGPLADDVTILVIKRLTAANYPPAEDLTPVPPSTRR